MAHGLAEAHAQPLPCLSGVRRVVEYRSTTAVLQRRCGGLGSETCGVRLCGWEWMRWLGMAAYCSSRTNQQVLCHADFGLISAKQDIIRHSGERRRRRIGSFHLAAVEARLMCRTSSSAGAAAAGDEIERSRDGLAQTFGCASSQFSTVSPGTRENSFLFAVTRMDLVARACAAISMSFGPMGVPACSR